jgi:ubiquinone/menaquinone biosynthesis C-methylase UbiE
VAGDFYDSAFGRAYSAYMERPWLSRIVSRVVWGGDLAPYYERMAAVAELPDGATVVDCPCGAGPVFRAVPVGKRLRYLAVDLSPSMLARAGERAEARGIAAEFIRADAANVGLPGGSADLFLSFWGLHCFDDPAAALAEMCRIVKPGGRLLGATFVRERGLRGRLLIRDGSGDFGRVGTVAEMDGWIEEAGFSAELQIEGPMLYFDAHRVAFSPS